jgi:hypothetical protein
VRTVRLKRLPPRRIAKAGNQSLSTGEVARSTASGNRPALQAVARLRRIAGLRPRLVEGYALPQDRHAKAILEDWIRPRPELAQTPRQPDTER